jgi:ribosomal protein S18 acetylase RimI-like enzyme
MKSPRIRKLRGTDYRDVELTLAWAFQWRSSRPEPAVPPELLYIIDGWGSRQGDGGLGAYDPDSGEFLGGVFWRLWKNDFHSYGFLAEDIPELGIAVNPEHRGRGIGGLLLQRAQREICRLAFEGRLPRAAVSLSVERDNRLAGTVYRNHGFETVEERESDLLMLWRPDAAVEPMETGDIPAAVDLWKRTPGVWINEDGEDSEEELREFLEHNSGLNFVVRCDAPGHQALAGAVICGCDGRRGYVHHLAVLPAFRRRGLGRGMLDAIRNALAERGIRKMHLFVFGTNTAAQEFYRRLEWQYRDDLAMFSMPTGERGQGPRERTTGESGSE